MSLQYRIAPEGQVRDVDDGKRQVLVSFPWETLDSYNTDFDRAAFDEHLQQALPIMVWQHVRSEPIGRAKEWQKTQAANEFVAGFSDFDAVPRARQAFSQLRDGELTDFSYGFDRAKSMPHPSIRGAVRFSSARMAEISPVSVGSIPGAVAVGIRAEAEVANVRGLLDAGAIDEAGANEMLRAAGLDPLPRQRVEIASDPLADAVREALAQHGDRDLVIHVSTDGTVTTDTTAPDEADGTGGDGDYDRTTVIAAVDGAIDAALSYAEQLDLSTLPDAVGMVVQLLNAADVACDELMEGEGIPDYDGAADIGGTGMAGEMSAADGEERAAVEPAAVEEAIDEAGTRSADDLAVEATLALQRLNHR